MTEELHLTRKDFRVDWFSGKGGGGQYRNKHRNCCRITHIESGLVATGQSNRDRPSNQGEAFEKLARMVLAWFYADDEARSRYGSTERVRTYHAERNQVKDHLSGATMEYRECVDKPNIGPMIDARAKAARSSHLEEQ